MLQANYLRQLNQRGDAEAVIRQFEGGRVTSNEATLGEYVKALVKVDRLDSSALVSTLQVSSENFLCQLSSSCVASSLLAVCEFLLRWLRVSMHGSADQTMPCMQRGAQQARQGGASTSCATAFGSFASQASQEAPATSSGLSRMFGGTPP